MKKLLLLFSCKCKKNYMKKIIFININILTNISFLSKLSEILKCKYFLSLKSSNKNFRKKSKNF